MWGSWSLGECKSTRGHWPRPILGFISMLVTGGQSLTGAFSVGNQALPGHLGRGHSLRPTLFSEKAPLAAGRGQSVGRCSHTEAWVSGSLWQ